MKSTPQFPAWQPIENAPDGKWAITYAPYEARAGGIVEIAFADGPADEDGLYWHDGGTRLYPTHWMPLPEAPE